MYDWEVIAGRELMTIIGRACNDVGLAEGDLELALQTETELKQMLRHNEHPVETWERVRETCLDYAKSNIGGKELVSNLYSMLTPEERMN